MARLMPLQAEIDAGDDAASELDLDPISDTVEKDQLESAYRSRCCRDGRKDAA